MNEDLKIGDLMIKKVSELRPRPAAVEITKIKDEIIYYKGLEFPNGSATIMHLGNFGLGSNLFFKYFRKVTDKELKLIKLRMIK